MKFFVDTEFIEDGKTIDLLSIGIVAEDGRALYMESKEADFDKANDWVKANVFPQLFPVGSGYKSTKAEIRNEVLKFVGADRPEFWGYYADYDWVVFCWLFGSMIDLPKEWPMYCRDIKQLCDDLGNPRLPEQGKGEHNALADARWNKLAFEFLEGLKHGHRVE
jgi:hypothetical protein